MTQQPLRREVLRALQTLNTPTVANAIETFDVRPRSTGFMSSDVRCALPNLGVMVGYAATAKIRATLKPEPGAAVNRRVMWEHILSLPEPRVVVIQDLDEAPMGSFWGEVNANIHRALGCVGTVTNGGVRDLDEVEMLGFHLFASHIQVSHAYVHVVEVGTPVEVYARPASVFVAGFLGAPGMNLFDAEITSDGQAVAVGGAGVLRLPRPAVAGSGEVVLGLRPEALAPSPRGEWAFDILLREALGAETLLHGRVGRQPCVVRVGGDAQWREGQRIALTAPPAALHLFDRASGERLPD